MNILHLGDRISSKTLQEAFKSFKGSYHHFSDHHDTIDPIEIVDSFHRSEFLIDSGNETSQVASYLNSVIELDKNVDSIQTDLLSASFTEAGIMRSCMHEIPTETPIWVGNSLAIRQYDSYVRKDGKGQTRGSNRGVSGIDGQIASAAGFSLASGKKGFLVIGDLGFLHDLNSLNLLRQTSMTVLVINNDGGGIFSRLPIERHEDVFEKYFATPHNLSFENAASLFGLDYANPSDINELGLQLKKALQTNSSSIIEVRTSRKETKEFALNLRKEIREQLSKLS